MRTIHIDGNGCLRCHRIGMETLAEYTGDHWDPNEHMPPHAPGSLAADHEDLVACWENGPEWRVAPARVLTAATLGSPSSSRSTQSHPTSSALIMEPSGSANSPREYVRWP